MFLSILNLLTVYRRFVTTGLLVVFSLLFLFFFSESESFSPALQRFIVSIVFLLIIPLLYSRMVMKESLRSLGFQKGNFWVGSSLGVLSVLCAFGIFWWVIFSFPSFRESYVLPSIIETNFFWFTFYELVVVSIIVMLYEVFFRGLIQFFWLKDVRMWAIVIQVLCFLIFSINDLSWQRVPLLIFCPFAGLVAYFSKSLWYSFLASWIFLFLVDIFFLVSH